MKKWIAVFIGLAAAVGLMLTATGAWIKSRQMSVAIIGGADGQTAIRIAENAGAQVSTGTQAGKVAELPGEDEETVNLSRKLLASGDFTQASALAFLVFILLYFPALRPSLPSAPRPGGNGPRLPWPTTRCWRGS